MLISVNDRDNYEPVKLSWEHRFRSYTLQYSVNKKFINPVTVFNLKGNTYFPELPPGTYYFRVCGNLEKSRTKYSAPVSATLLLDPSLSIIKNTGFLFRIDGNLYTNDGKPLFNHLHTKYKNIQDNSDRTCGLYFPSCKIIIMCSTQEKANKLYNKYSLNKVSLGNGNYTEEPAHKSIQIVNLPNNVDKFKFISKQMNDKHNLASYHTSNGIGDGYNENDFVFFLKMSTLETLKSEAPNFMGPFMVASPFFLKRKENQHVIIKKDAYTSYLKMITSADVSR